VKEDLQKKLGELEFEIKTLRASLSDKEKELRDVYSSTTWKFGQLYGRFLGAESLWRRKFHHCAKWFAARLGQPPSYLQGKEDIESVEVDDSHRNTTRNFIERVKAAKGVFIIVSHPKLGDDAGTRAYEQSHRGIWLAKEWSRMGYGVLFVYCIRRPQAQLMKIISVNDNFLQMSLAVFSKLHGTVFRELSSCQIPKILFLETPYRYVTGFLKSARASDFITAYDIVDNWEEFNRAGWSRWYERAMESFVVNNVGIKVTPSDVIREKFSESGEIDIVRNAYSPDIAGRNYTRPLRKGRITVGYIGNMGTQRFDWDLLLSIAGRHDDWLFYLIGSPFPKLVEKRENLIYLGEIRYDLLHSYAANWDAAIIPFKKNNITITLDNLKVYEYLFLRLPVVARGVGEHFRRYPYVYVAEDEREFENHIEKTGSIEMEEEVMVDFLRTADWTTRAEEILKIIEGHSRPGTKGIV
jgi:hypothetical protein